MTIIYLDESGDLGMGEKGSKYFVITAIKIDSTEARTHFERIPRKIRSRKLSKKEMKSGEIKFSNSSQIIRSEFLRRVAGTDVGIYALVIDKSCTYSKLKENLGVLYNYLLKIVLERPITHLDKDAYLEICLDKCMSPSQRSNFENYVMTEFIYKFKQLPKVEIRHEVSTNNPGLQVTDFVCGAFGYKYNTKKLATDCDVYTKIIGSKVRLERTDLFWKKVTNPA